MLRTNRNLHCKKNHGAEHGWMLCTFIHLFATYPVALHLGQWKRSKYDFDLWRFTTSPEHKHTSRVEYWREVS